MMVLILILLLLAAIFGVLGAVLKFTAIVVFTLTLAFVIMAAVGWWAVKRWASRVGDQVDRQVAEQRAIKYRENEADPGELPPSHDDRY